MIFSIIKDFIRYNAFFKEFKTHISFDDFLVKVGSGIRNTSYRLKVSRIGRRIEKNALNQIKEGLSEDAGGLLPTKILQKLALQVVGINLIHFITSNIFRLELIQKTFIFDPPKTEPFDFI